MRAEDDQGGQASRSHLNFDEIEIPRQPADYGAPRLAVSLGAPPTGGPQ